MKSDRNNPMFMPYPNVNMQGMYPIMPGVNELENRINSLERIVKVFIILKLLIIQACLICIIRMRIQMQCI